MGLNAYSGKLDQGLMFLTPRLLVTQFHTGALPIPHLDSLGYFYREVTTQESISEGMV